MTNKNLEIINICGELLEDTKDDELYFASSKLSVKNILTKQQIECAESWCDNCKIKNVLGTTCDSLF